MFVSWMAKESVCLSVFAWCELACVVVLGVPQQFWQRADKEKCLCESKHFSCKQTSVDTFRSGLVKYCHGSSGSRLAKISPGALSLLCSVTLLCWGSVTAQLPNNVNQVILKGNFNEIPSIYADSFCFIWSVTMSIFHTMGVNRNGLCCKQFSMERLFTDEILPMKTVYRSVEVHVWSVDYPEYTHARTFPYSESLLIWKVVRSVPSQIPQML